MQNNAVKGENQATYQDKAYTFAVIDHDPVGPVSFSRRLAGRTGQVGIGKGLAEDVIDLGAAVLLAGVGAVAVEDALINIAFC